MAQINFDSLKVGDSIPSLEKGPISRTSLALFAGASGDHNPIHIDIDYAKAAGMPDVFVPGMLSMAYLGQMLTAYVPQSSIKSFGVQFSAITQIGDTLTCKGAITKKYEENFEKLVQLRIEAVNQDGECKLAGEAIVSFS
jgi:acyl dehydratase